MLSEARLIAGALSMPLTDSGPVSFKANEPPATWKLPMLAIVLLPERLTGPATPSALCKVFVVMPAPVWVMPPADRLLRSTVAATRGAAFRFIPPPPAALSSRAAGR